MIDRRQFISAMAMMPMAGIAGQGFSQVLVASVARPDTIVLFDNRYSTSRDFACTAHADCKRFDIGGDVGTVWYGTILPMLKSTPMALHGVTLASDFFTLAVLSGDAGLHVVRQTPLETTPSQVHWIIALQ